MSDLFQTVAKIAPTLADTLIPGAPLIKSVVGMIAKAFGADEQNEEQLIQKINHDPEREAKLLQVQKEIELEFEKLRVQSEERVLENSETLANIAYLDKKSARDREAELAKTNNPDDTVKKIAVWYTLFYFSIIILHMLLCAFIDYNEIEQKIFDQINSGLNSGMMLILGYYFGSGTIVKYLSKKLEG